MASRQWTTAFAGNHQRVDLDEGTVQCLEHPRQIHEQVGELPDLGAFQPERERHFPSLVRLGAHVRVDRRAQDFLRRLGGDLFYLHAAFAGSHDHHAARRAVDHGAEVQLARDVRAGFNVDLADGLAVGVGLDGDQALAEPAVGEIAHVVDRLRDLHSARLAATARMHLHLADPARAAELRRRRDRRVGAVRGDAGGYRHAVIGEQPLSLVFVQVQARLAIQERLRKIKKSARRTTNA